MPNGLRILVANEPRAYHEAHAFALREFRPESEVIAVDPVGLDTEFDGHALRLVICSALTDAIQARAFTWILLYPDEANLAVTCVAGHWRVIHGVSFDDLLAVVDETARRVALASPVAPLGGIESSPITDVDDAASSLA